MDFQPFRVYLEQISLALKAGNATEHTHRPALKTLVEALDATVTATNEPKRIACGAPDYIVTRGPLPLGYIEAKEVGTDLDTVENSEQLQRYRAGLGNLLLTDYLEFRWYVGGERRLAARLELKFDAAAVESVAELLTQFFTAAAPGINTPRELAIRLAAQARLLRGLIQQALATESVDGSLYGQLQSIRDVLLPHLTAEQFSDLYAQTLCYGLFTARCHAQPGEHFTRQHAAYDLPRTNPFLRTLFSHVAGPDLNENIAWAVDDVAELLARADLAAILQDFGQRTGQEDPVVHFYETFLAAYDPALRELRGVYYTPEPVVSWLVRSVDVLLKQAFQLPLGLADSGTINVREGEQEIETHRVQILDPATGTGTFLYGVIRQIHAAFAGNQGLWSVYVREHLLPRLYGFELLMAPYTVAHLKLGLLLRETGYDFASDDRLQVYLTNALDQAQELKHLPLFGEWLVREARQAAHAKQNAPIMVVLGNPPYSGHSANQGEWIAGLLRGLDGVSGQKTGNYFMADGQPLGERNPKWLNDDYVKFIRFAQWRIERTGYGILALITNHGYLDNLTFRGMRQSLMATFEDIYLLDLHGNSKKKEKAPEGIKDENVFDIQQGVAIGLFVRSPRPAGERLGVRAECRVHHAELWGERKGKYQWLMEHDVQNTEWRRLEPNKPCYLFVPKDLDLLAEYESGWKINEMMPVNSAGIVTARDDLAIHWNKNEVWETVQDFSTLPAEQAREKYHLGQDVRDWKVSLAQDDLKSGQGLSKDRILPVLYRPFDIRYTYYTGKDRGFICRTRLGVMKHIIKKPNIGLITTRMTKDQWDCLPTRMICGHKSCAAYDINTLFPLYLYSLTGKECNFSTAFIASLEQSLKLSFIPEGQGDLQATVGPEDIFYYVYAIFHSPTYRRRYADFLKRDFPRLPLTTDQSLFQQLCKFGTELTALHLLECDAPAIATYPAAGANRVETVRYAEPNDAGPGRVWINTTQYFQGIPPDVWNFYVGGYQVLAKWLKDRKGRVLGFDELFHYQRVAATLQRTLQIQQAIDEAIGEWPLH
jgi:predicted helicase